MTESKDYIGLTTDLIAKLRTEGLPEWAEVLDQDMSSASTGGELVMAVRDDLRKLLDTKPALRSETIELAQRIIRVIDATGW